MKKALTIIGIIICSLALLTGSVVGLLHLKVVQTYIIDKVASHFAEKMNIDVEIQEFHYRPLSHLNIENIYLSDQQKDTLAYIEELDLNFNPLKLRDKHLDIKELKLTNPYINLQELNDSTLNCQFLLEVFKQDSTTLPFDISVQHLVLEQTRFRYNQLFVDQFDLALTLPILSQDSMNFYVESMHIRAQIDRLHTSLEAQLHGNLDSIFADNLRLNYHGQQVFNGNVGVYHPLNLDSLYIAANCERLLCDSTILDGVLGIVGKRDVTIPQQLLTLKQIKYSGKIKGRLENLNLQGAFSSPLGVLNVVGIFQLDMHQKRIAFAGDVITDDLDLNQMLPQKELGKVSFSTHINGTIDSTKQVLCEANAKIKKFEYKGYCYRDIQVNGQLDSIKAHGNLNINDENLKLELNGHIDWVKKNLVDIKIRIADFVPAALNMTESHPNLRIKANTSINLRISKIYDFWADNLAGLIKVDSILLQNNDEEFTTQQPVKIIIDNGLSQKKQERSLIVVSKIRTFSLSGKYSYKSIPLVFKHILHKSLPTLIEKPQEDYPQDVKIKYTVSFHHLNQLFKVLNLGLQFHSQTPDQIVGSIDGEKISLTAKFPEIKTDKGGHFKDGIIKINNPDNGLEANMSISIILPKDNPVAEKLGDITTSCSIFAKNDSVNLDINFEGINESTPSNKGRINVGSYLSIFQNKPRLDIAVKQTQIILNDSSWTINPTTITYTHSNKTTQINNFRLGTDYQSLQADGRISKSKKDSVNINLHNLNVDYLLSFTEASKAITVQGPVTGNATLYNVLSNVMLEANAQIKNAGLNGVYLGDVTATAKLDKPNKSIIVEGEAKDSTNHRVAVIDGTIIPSEKKWVLNVDCDSVDLRIIDFWTKQILSNPQGRGYGKIQIKGIKRDVTVTGLPSVKNAQITLPQIGATFSFDGTIDLQENFIRFNKIILYDQYKNEGIFDGALYHKNFMNFHYEFTALANNMHVMDLPANPQSLFYGQVFATGDVHIKGNEETCGITVNAQTEANTKFYLKTNTASQASNSDFIQFVQPDTVTKHQQALQKKEVIPETTTKLILELNGQVTPQAEINILFGGEDAIRGKGEGALKLIYESPSEDISMQGNYSLHSGQFSISLGNIVRRNFTIDKGSINWVKDPMDPTLDITGHYHTTASLRDLFGSESAQIATDRTSVPVNCVLKLTDKLFKPILKFEIELPQSDESVQSQVKSIINTEEKLMRQMIYLLVFNRFYTPEYLQNTQNVGLNETYSLLSSTLTGQINSWLSKLTDVFTMGFNFRTDGEGETASQEYEANFQIHPINQLIINGNFGYRYNDLSNRPFFGDLDIEYLLTENGKLRIKAYTHTVDKYSLRQANMVQGVGFVFKHDFNWKKKSKKDKNTTQKDNKKERKAKKEKSKE